MFFSWHVADNSFFLPDGHYLNLPVMNDGGEIVGMVDVLKLTYATLEQINGMSSSGDSEGPAWNKFWLSLDDETESMVSGGGTHQGHSHVGSRSLMSPDIHRDRIVDSVAPCDSASHAGMESPPPSALAHSPDLPPGEIPFPFKFKAPSGRVHRLQVIAANGMDTFVVSVLSKLGAEVDAIGGAPTVEDGRLSGTGFGLSYLDDEGDSVSITTDQDLLEAILLARQNHRDKVDLFVHDPDKPPVSAQVPTPLPEPVVVAATPPASSVVRERRRRYEDEDSESEDEEDYSPRRGRRQRNRHHHSKPEQVISGVPNELLLPGAIAALAVVIVATFTIGRMTNNR